jgi:hypothetical protein
VPRRPASTRKSPSTTPPYRWSRRASIREWGLRTQFGNKLDYLQTQQQFVEMQHERVAEQKKRDEAEAALAELAAECSKNRGRVQAHRFDQSGCNSAANSPAIPLQVPLQFRCWKSAQIRHKLLIL